MNFLPLNFSLLFKTSQLILLLLKVAQPMVVQPSRVQLIVAQPMIAQLKILQLLVVCIFATLKIYFLYQT